jgi:hypothetical protein
MPDWLTSGALPIGLIMFSLTMLGFLRKRTGWYLAKRQLPGLASELGLGFVAPRYDKAMGSLRGRYKGYRVHVDPDDRRAIVVSFEHEPRVDLRTYEHSTRPPHGMVTVFSGERSFDHFFKTRFAVEELAQRLGAVRDWNQKLAVFRGRYAKNVRSLSVTASGVTCVLDFGSPPFIPAEAVRELLPASVELASLFEPEKP